MVNSKIGDIRKKLLRLYGDFIANPDDQSVINRVIKFDRQYGRLPVCNDLLINKVIPSEVVHALNHLSTIYQYGMGPYENRELIRLAKNVLAGLQKRP